MSRSLSTREVERQVLATQASPKKLPVSWWEPGCAERMAAWIDRNVPERERIDFRYGAVNNP